MNRTSSTRSASRGTPYLKPKLMSWIDRRSEPWTSPRRAKIRSRSSRSERSLVSSTTSAWVRTESSIARSSSMEAAIPRSSASGCRWRVSREAADQDVVAGLEEDDHRPDAAPLERAAHRPERERHVAGPDVDDDGRAAVALGLGGDQVRQVPQQLAGQVVHDDVAQVLEQLGGGRLAAAREAGEHDHLPVVRGLRRDRAGAGSVEGPASCVMAPRRASLAAAADEEDRALEEQVHGRAEGERADEVRAGRDARGEDRDDRGRPCAATRPAAGR